MKRIPTLTSSLAIVLLTGCVTLSVYPYFTTKDLQFDPALLGVWSEPGKADDAESWTFEKSGDQSYRLTIAEKNKRTEFEARLFKLKNYAFLDCLPSEHSDYSVPCHLLLRVDQVQPTLDVRPLNYEWLGRLLEKEPKAIRHTIISHPVPPKGDEDRTFVLTADTPELQRFILKHIQNKEAWKDKLVMTKS